MKHNQMDLNWRPVAFKEWQLVADALATGEQSVILRKGGISEGKRGFEWLHDRFFLFPSRFHEQVNQVKNRSDGRSREMPISLAPEGKVAFSVFIETISTGYLGEWEEIERLDPFHIWSEDIIRERYEWGEEPGISYAVVKAFSVDPAWILDDRKSFGGCRSWFGMPSDENGGWQQALESAQEAQPGCGLPNWLI